MTSPLLPAAHKRAILLAGVTAVALHALAFAFLQLRDRRPDGDHGQPRSADNTAELLQFSSQSDSSSRGRDDQGVPPSLPLPPPPDLSPANTLRTGHKRVAAAAGATRRAGQGAFPVRTSGKDRRQGVSRRAGLDQSAPRGLDRQRDWSEAMERLRAAVRQEQPSRSTTTSANAADPESALENQTTLRLASDSPLTLAYQSVWRQARPYAVPLGAGGHNTEPAEVRQASWQEVRTSQTPIRHGQVVVLPETVLLFWLQGEQLYLLQSPRQNVSGS